MGWRDFVPDSAEDWVEDRAEDAGDLVEWGGNKVAGAADRAGLHEAGDWVRDQSRSVANQLGAEVAELELGQTDDPKKLVYGSVAKIREQVSHLTDFKTSFEAVGNGLKGLGEPDGLKGASAEAFRRAVAKEPPRWFKAAEAFGKAADALDRFAETVEWAQGRAKEALEDYNKALKASQDAFNAHKKLVDTYKDAVAAKKEHLPPRPPEDYADPGKAMTAAAQEKLDGARRQRDEQAQTAAAVVRAARDAAPPKPSYAEQLGDGLDYLDLASTHLVGGAVKGTAGIVNGARALNPFDPYNMAHPAEFFTNLNSTAAGLVTMVNDPWGTGKQMLDAFMKDPSEGVGRLIPELIGSKGSGLLKKFSKPLRGKTCKGDPVDVATGDMVLQHTDLSLPGVLPLTLTRTHLSGYRWGHWFGRSWASTLDERIEVGPDGIGAIWAREDGSLLVYPRLPEPAGDPVLPLDGPQLPLSHDGEAFGTTTYSISDPRAGLTRSFTGHPYNPSSAHWLTSIEDRYGSSVTIARGPAGTPRSLSHSGGYSVTVDTQEQRVGALRVRTPDGPVEVRRYGFDDRGDLDAIFNSSGLPLRLTYDEHGRITSWTDRNSSTFVYKYDDEGRVVRTVGPQGFLSSALSYGTAHAETGHSITRYTDSTGATTTFHINDRLQVVAETDPLGHTTRCEADDQDRLVAVTDALGHTTFLERNTDGAVVAMVAPDGERTTASYDGLGRPTVVTERGGVRHTYTYDADGSITATGPTGARTRRSFDGVGAVRQTEGPTGLITHVVNNRAGLPVEVTAPDGATALYVRDAFGRITHVTDALGGTLTQQWTPEGLLSWRVLPDGSREEWTWDGEGNLLTHTDRMGRTSHHKVTHFDRAASTTSQDGGRYQYTHDTELRLTKVNNAEGYEWTYTYDPAGRLVAETDFDCRTITYEHDAVGRLTRRTNAAGQSLTFERDALGRVTRLIHDDGAASVFSFGPQGHVTRIINDHADITLAYDAAGRILAETVNGRMSTFGYDAQGRRSYRRTPSGAVSCLVFDATGLASYTMGEHVFRFERDAMGRESTRLLDNSLRLRQAWDPVGRVVHQDLAADGTSVLKRSFTYQADGSPTVIDDSGLGRRHYTLNAASRITAVQAKGWNEQYAYNTAGDQTDTRLPTQTPGQDEIGPRAYSGTRITRSGRTRYTYDAQGRLSTRTTTTLSGKSLTWIFAWNAEDRLTQVTTPDNVIWRYGYDALGRRITRERLSPDGSPAETYTYTWDGAQLAEQNDGHTTLTWDYTGLLPLAQREVKRNSSQEEVDRRFFAIVADLSGAPTAMVRPDGSLAWRARSTVWGATQWNRDATAYTPLRYPGQTFDPETGLHYNFNQYYDPATGRYISPDPLGLAPAANHYSYVPNPFTLWDPLGLAGCEADPTWGDRVVFTRDEHGRPYEMHATVTRDMLNEGTDANQALRPPGFIHGNVYNQGRGHMLAQMLGGSGDTLDNLFTITQNPTNSPVMRDLEKSIYNAVRGDPANNVPGQTVQYSVYLEYTDDLADSVPRWITMEADGRDGFTLRDDFQNPDHANQQLRRRGSP
ncbi:putative T7SS-secreted protein [Streptomyces virginiae]|uniref:putative T7SS-secreted protein n=1 Tax=Streptomyces virginiae TaxID=1961 RepID=UPI0036F5AAF3